MTESQRGPVCPVTPRRMGSVFEAEIGVFVVAEVRSPEAAIPRQVRVSVEARTAVLRFLHSTVYYSPVCGEDACQSR